MARRRGGGSEGAARGTMLDPGVADASSRQLPDAVLGHARHALALDRVGMRGVECVVRVAGEDGGELLLPARADCLVSLDDPAARGIHMSRLFLALQEHLEAEPLTPAVLGLLLDELIASQRGLSSSGSLRVAFQLPVRRNALVSGHSAWRCYPVAVCAERHGSGRRSLLELAVAYSSTCPSSAALAQQAVSERLAADFGEREEIAISELRAWIEDSGPVATPHSQRSTAEVVVLPCDAEDAPGLVELIDAVEGSLGTPVQSAVKREDEQDFARRNAENLMFSEDAARRIVALLAADDRIGGYRVRVSHYEGLHPHDAVAEHARGL